MFSGFEARFSPDEGNRPCFRPKNPPVEIHPIMRIIEIHTNRPLPERGAARVTWMHALQRRFDMSKTECFYDRVSSRTIGAVVFILSLLLAVIGTIVLPVFGFFFALPLIVMAGVFVFAPDSKACRLLTAKKE